MLTIIKSPVIYYVHYVFKRIARFNAFNFAATNYSTPTLTSALPISPFTRFKSGPQSLLQATLLVPSEQRGSARSASKCLFCISIKINPNWKENELKLENAGSLTANDSEPVPEFIRNIFGKFVG